MPAGVQAVPFQKNIAVEVGLTTTPCIVKLVEPVFDTNATRPLVVTVGLGSVSVWLAVVWLTPNVVATSTVVVAVPITPPVALSVIVIAVNKVLLALVKVLPAETVRLPFTVVVIPDRPNTIELALVAPKLIVPLLPVSTVPTSRLIEPLARLPTALPD